MKGLPNHLQCFKNTRWLEMAGLKDHFANDREMKVRVTGKSFYCNRKHNFSSKNHSSLLKTRRYKSVDLL